MKKLSLLCVIALSGCSTIMEGNSQTISVATDPSGATCELERQGNKIGTVKTPGSIVVEKSKYDIRFYCNKPSYKEKRYTNYSGIQGATFGNILLGGGIGWAIDSSTGADNKYEENVYLTMEKK